MFLTVDLAKHLWHEDEWLYPVLRKASEHNKKLKEILRLFDALRIRIEYEENILYD